MPDFSAAEIAEAEAFLARLDAEAIRHELDVSGRRMVWREWGTGPALVLIHGGHGSWRHWARNIDPLARHFRVLAPDLPGFGDSDDVGLPPHDPDRLERVLEGLVRSIDQLVGAAPVFLTGFSFGGAVAGSLAPRLPGLRRLALLGSAGHGGRRRDREPLSDWRAVTGHEREQALVQNLQAFMLSSGPAIDALALRIHARSCEMTRFRSKAISRQALLGEALQDFGKPALLVWGEADVTAVPDEAGARLTQGYPQRTWQTVAGAGHWVQFEKADEINDRLIQWFVND